MYNNQESNLEQFKTNGGLMAYYLSDIIKLLELHMRHDSGLNDIFIKNLKGSGTRLAARVLYNRMLAHSVDSSGYQRWMLKPQKGCLTRPDNFKAFLEDDSKTGINSADLLLYASPATYTKAMRVLLNTGLIHVDKFNKMTLNYPVDGKMLSLVYAAKAIKSSYKKDSDEETSLDTNDENNVESQFNHEDDKDFWDK